MILVDAALKKYSSTTTIGPLELEISEGGITALVGPNGAGKSTLLAALAGELSPSAGRITLNGRPLSAWSAAELARCRAVLPQSPSLQFDLPVATVIGMGAYPHARHARTGASRTGCRDTAQSAIAEDQRILQRVLALADVQDLYERRYRRLSGGEQQRVHLARVLYQLLLARQGHDEYRVLMLDEPTASLDPRHQLHLLSAVHTLAHEENVAALVIMHDLNLAAGCCDRLLLLGQGRVAACGTPAQVLTPDTLRQVYGVEATVLPHPNQPGRPLVVF